MKRMPPPPEREVQRTFVAHLEAWGCEVHRRNVAAFPITTKGVRYYVKANEKGMADLWGFLPEPVGLHFECEVKRPGAWPTPAQVDWLRRTNRHRGARAFWAWDIETLKYLFDEIMDGLAVVVHADGRQSTRLPVAPQE